MRFTRLRLSGFKSFAEPTDFRIEPGLTGVVGPNGCGKSNLLEALRWVMGANSAKALRGEGMDDVIFSGSADRPSRSHAEATLTLERAEEDQGAEFGVAPVIEVVRRIDRGEGSRFRVNGREVRARDVQLLFADASTGANSPALVRQGQISELIAARPQNRRRILEEAAGVSGLHGRRHEVELRVRAAEANLARLQDVMAEVEANLGRVRREARQAERYRRIAGEIRALQGALARAHLGEARAAFARAAAEAEAAAVAVEMTAREAAVGLAAALAAEEAIRPRRDDQTAAAAILHRLSIEKDRIDRAVEEAAAECSRREVEISRIEADCAREAQIVADGSVALARLRAELEAVRRETALAPERLPTLEAEARQAEATRSQAESAVEALATQAAAAEARAMAAESRRDEAIALLARTDRALAQARAERESLGNPLDHAGAEARAELVAAQAALTTARGELASAEEALGLANVQEREAREAARSAEDALASLLAEARGLASATSRRGSRDFPSVIEHIVVPVGLEAALAAALGADLEAALDPEAPRFWRGAASTAPAWPEGVTPLGAKLKAPAQLSAALALVGLVDSPLGARLQASLPSGASLVSRDGDLWRWDGFTARAEAVKPTQVLLEQKARLARLETQIETQSPAVRQVRELYAEANERLASAQEAARSARTAPLVAEERLSRARDAMERAAREGARRESRAASLDETISRFVTERDEAAGSLAAAEAQIHADPIATPDLSEARAAAAATLETAVAARTALDFERHEVERRRHRMEALERDAADWSQRTAQAESRLATLAAAGDRAAEALAAAKAAPQGIETRRAALFDDLTAAEARMARSGDALARAETLRAEAERRSRAADAAASAAREARAADVARLEAAKERLAEQLSAAGGVSEAAEEPSVSRLTPDQMESRLVQLDRDREGLGAVNLRAEEEARDLGERFSIMRAEQADLAGALARLRQALTELNREGRERLVAAFDVVNGHFRSLFTTLFEGGEAELRLVESDDPLEAGLEIFACPPGKRMAVMSLMSGGEQALTAVALIFAVFLANPAPVCFLDEVDAPLDDANIERFCNLLDAMRRRAPTRFVAITHNPLTMSRMDRLFGVTMPQRGVSQLVSVDLRQAEALAAQ